MQTKQYTHFPNSVETTITVTGRTFVVASARDKIHIVNTPVGAGWLRYHEVPHRGPWLIDGVVKDAHIFTHDGEGDTYWIPEWFEAKMPPREWVDGTIS